jgi:hypothetical protein
MSDIIQTKKELAEEWENIQNANVSVENRKIAYQRIVELTNKIRETDKTFTLNEKALEKFAEFKPTNVPRLDTNTKWVEPKSGTQLEKLYNEYVAIALSIVQQRCPTLSADSDKFGTIVNATISNLIALHNRPNL